MAQLLTTSITGNLTVSSFVGIQTTATDSLLSFAVNKKQMSFRDNHSSYDCFTYYGTSGNEALTFGAQYSGTHFQFINGVQSSDFNSSYWNSLTPGLDVSNNNVCVGGLSGTDYKFKVIGTSYLNGQVYMPSSYGSSLPSSAIAGQIFFKTV